MAGTLGKDTGPRGSAAGAPVPPGAGSGYIDYLRRHSLRVWGGFIVPILGVIVFFGVAYVTVHRAEEVRLLKTARDANDDAVAHCRQVANQVDTLLRAVRGYHLRVRSLADTTAFIQSLGFDRSLIDAITLVTADAQVADAGGGEAAVSRVADRDYYAFHRARGEDQLFISAVEDTAGDGGPRFYFTRRIEAPDGGFGGLVRAAVKPEAIADFFRRPAPGSHSFAALVARSDQRLRARVPAPLADHWARPLASPLWDALARGGTDHYEYISPIDQVLRVEVFKQVPGLPLVMVTGFSPAESMRGVHRRMFWFPVAFAFIVGCSFLLALLLTLEAKRRDEQERFMAMLSHELKTPLSVIRLTLGGAGLPAATKARVGRTVADMDAIIERCLQSDRLRAGRINPVPAPCRVEDLLAGLREDLGTPPRLRIHVEPLPVCMTDRELLGVVLRNLCDNALKYGSPQAPVGLTATPARSRGRAGIHIAVANAPGPAGMPDPRRVFKKYYRAPGAHGKTGSGLGLHIAHGCAHRLGGRLRYRPAAGEVRFELWLPV